MSDYFVKRAAWRYQINSSRIRNIPFQITFEDWCQWWESNLGKDWFKKRGRRRGQYVMARKGDIGSYHLNNILCLKVEENISQMKRKPERFSSTPPQTIIKIYQFNGCMSELSQKLKINYAVIWDVRNDRSWMKLTKELRRGKDCPCANGVPCAKGFKRYPKLSDT